MQIGEFGKCGVASCAKELTAADSEYCARCIRKYGSAHFCAECGQPIVRGKCTGLARIRPFIDLPESPDN